MPLPTAQQFSERFATGLALDHFWSETMGKPDQDKGTALAAIVGIFEATGTPYAIIGGVAVQLYTEEPRTTLDLDIAVESHSQIPREQLLAAGFKHEGSYEWSDNWRAPQGIAVQFSEIPWVLNGAQKVDAGTAEIRLVALPDLVLLKLAAAEEPRRRPSKRTHDKADVQQLLEEHPELDSAEIRARLEKL